MNSQVYVQETALLLSVGTAHVAAYIGESIFWQKWLCLVQRACEVMEENI